MTQDRDNISKTNTIDLGGQDLETLTQLERISSILGESVIAVDQQIRIIHFNKASEKLFGFTQEEVLGDTLNKLIPKDFHEKHEKMAHKFITTDSRPKLMADRNLIWGQHKDGHQFPIEISLTNIQFGALNYSIAVSRDMSNYYDRENKFRYRSEHDPLTGLYNRQFMLDHFSRLINKEDQEDQENASAVLFIDLDKFKPVNDFYGHETGDRLLKTVAQRLKSSVREADFVVRVGGDEFVILMLGIHDKNIVTKIANNILLTLNSTFHINHQEIEISASIGIAYHPFDAETLEELVHHADHAMYMAKREHNSICFYRSQELNHPN